MLCGLCVVQHIYNIATFTYSNFYVIGIHLGIIQIYTDFLFTHESLHLKRKLV